MENTQKTEMLSISIVILNWNGRYFLSKCLESIKHINYPRDRFEVIVVDNASSDGSPKFVEKCYPGVKLIKNNKNYGFSIGNNIGIKNSTGDVIFLLNNDTELDPNVLNELNKMFIHSDVGVVGCQLYIGDTGYMQQSAYFIHSSGRGIDYQESIVYNIRRIGDNNYCQKNKLIDSGKIECDYVNGAAFAIRKNVLDEIGLLDPELTPDHEDKDICWRTKKAGYMVVMASTAFVLHFISQSWRKMPIRRIYLSERNRILFVLKHFEGRSLFKALTYSQFILWILSAVNLFRGQTVVQRVEKIKNMESHAVSTSSSIMSFASHVLLCLFLTSIWPLYQFVMLKKDIMRIQ